MAVSLLLELLPQQWQLSITSLILLAVSVVLIFWSRCRRNPSSRLKLPPGPTRLPIIGNLHQIGRLPHWSLGAVAGWHGPVMALRLGTVPVVVLSSPKAAQEALKVHDPECCSRSPSAGPRMLSYGYKDVAFSPYSKYVRDMRKLFVVELLSMRRVQAASFPACYAREAQVEKLIEKLTRNGRNAVAINEHIFSTVDGIIGTFALGETYAAEEFKDISETMDLLSSSFAEDFFPGSVAGRLVDRLTGLAARREAIFRKLDRFFERIVDQHAAADDDGPAAARRKADDKGSAGSDLVHELIDLWKMEGNTKQGFTKDHVKAMLLDTFVGGITTTSVTLHWAMSELIRNPRVMKKAQDEIRAVVGEKERVQHHDMPKLKYLKMVVKETFRLHPPATLLVPRETTRHFKVGGYDIPEKTKVIVNAWAIGRDPNIWKDPEEFIPERFEEMDIDFNGAHFELVPFGSGRRICPGLGMGVANIEFILASMLFCFDWELPHGVRKEDIDMEEAGKLTFHKKIPLLLVPTPNKAPN
ncbi:4-hydroxyphenylacetaldehyde oxime monooxygenase-like [Oryza glaberrima]|uniref:4-hydroxyphenylacetaldehyde oxime monooxygenase-like n=1 Tax=Oryza glaberrima TaxID=4538 RepID=UPI00224C2549|nr:4-hydroxyphenylacetaldehyde oxime monooxygenase-like [Oryza glaberrima]